MIILCDTECYWVNDIGPVWLVGVCPFNIDTYEIGVFEIIRSYDSNCYERLNYYFNQQPTIIGFNWHGYDKYIMHGILHKYSPLEVYQLNSKYFESQKGFKQTKFKYDYFKSPVIDIQLLGSLTTSLKSINAIRGYALEKKDFKKAFTKEEHAGMDYYLEIDVMSLAQWFKEFREDYDLRKSLIPKYGASIILKTKSEIGSLILSRFITERKPNVFRNNRPAIPNSIKLTTVIPNEIEFKTPKYKSFLEELKSRKTNLMETEFSAKFTTGVVMQTLGKGGLHSVNNPQFYSERNNIKLLDIDISSFYLILALCFQIYPKGIGPSFLSAIDTFLTLRLKYKALSKDKSLSSLERDSAKKDAETYKIALLSMIGKMSMNFSKGSVSNNPYYDPEAFFKITVAGQLLTLMIIEEIELNNNSKVFSANTDGIFIMSSEPDLVINVFTKFAKKFDFQFTVENIEKLLMLSVNEYTALYTSGEIKRKGGFLYENLPPGRSLNAPIIYKALEKQSFYNIHLNQTIRDYNEPLLSYCYTKRSQSANSKFSYDNIELPDMIRYLVSTNGINLVSGNKRLLVKGKNEQYQVTLINEDITDLKLKDKPEIDLSYYVQKSLTLYNGVNTLW